MKRYYYDAFISYRHKEMDSFAAEKIHKLLEHYHIPKRIQQVSGKKKIERVFRDREELPTSSSLADNIKTALENSEYLIVVCSPDVIESQWVQQEIALFLETHGRDKILAVLIAGEPDEAFPELLRIAKEEVVGDDGVKTVVCKMVEPLAADIRAESKKEMEKKLKKEILRLLAPLLACSYDDLRQRHREYRMQKMMTAAGTVCCLLLAFTGYALHQSAKIKEQYHIALEKESQYLSEVSAGLLESGDRMGALENALTALPGEGKEDRPLVPEAVFALNNALYSYGHDGALTFKPDRMLEADSQITDRAGFSTDAGYYMEMDKTGSIYFYDGQNGTLHWKMNMSEAEKAEGKLLAGRFFSDTKAAILTTKQLVFLDAKKKQVIQMIPFEQELVSTTPKFLVHEKYAAVIFDKDRTVVYDTASGKTVYQRDTSGDDFHIVSLKGWSEDGSVLAVEIEKEAAAMGWTETDLALITPETGEEQDIQREGDEVRDALFLDGSRIVILESKVLEKFGDDRVNQARIYDYANRKDVWVSKEYESHREGFRTELFSKSMKYEGSEKTVLGVCINDMLLLVDEGSGETFVETYFPDWIVGVGQYDNERLIVGMRDGRIRMQSLKYDPTPLYAGEISEEVSGFYYNRKDRVTIQNLRSGTASIVSRVYEDEGMRQIEEAERIKHVWHLRTDGENGKVYRVMTSEEKPEIVIQDMEGNGKLFTIPIKDERNGEPEICLFEKDGKLLLSYVGYSQKESYVLRTVEVESGKEVYRETYEEHKNMLYGHICYSNQSDMAADYAMGRFQLFRMSDGKTLFSLKEELKGENISAVWFSPDDKYLLLAVKKHTDETMRLKRWNIEKKTWEKDEFTKINLSDTKTDQIQFGYKKNLMAVYGNAKISILDTEKGTVWKEIPFCGESECNFAFANEDQYLLMYGDNQKLTLWDIEKEKAVMERKEKFAFPQAFEVDPAGTYFVVNESAGYSEAGMSLGMMHVYTLDAEQGEFYPYADVSRGWICFEKHEIGCTDLDGKVYVSPIRSLETLRGQAEETLK